MALYSESPAVEIISTGVKNSQERFCTFQTTKQKTSFHRLAVLHWNNLFLYKIIHYLVKVPDLWTSNVDLHNK